jgi:anion-transporting  ArsA/GET3 family ATPase
VKLFESKVIVCVGSGGVGKTTVAASMGYLAAEGGKSVLVLTVDPAQRLKTTLGISEGQNAVIKVGKGQLEAAIIDSKKTFDEFVLKATGRAPGAERILHNKLYQQLSTTLAGSQEFTSLEALYTAYESKNYDLIVLDTPPSKHAIDFLNAPQKISALFQEGVAKWFRASDTNQGFMASVLHSGTKQVFKILESLTGSDFIKELSEFFVLIESWQTRLADRTTNVHRMLVHTSASFVLISSLDEAKLKEAEYFAREIKKGGFHLRGFILNRSFPEYLAPELVNNESVECKDLAQSHNLAWSYFDSIRMRAKKYLDSLKQNYIALSLPEQVENISDLRGVAEFSKILDRELQREERNKYES